MDVAEFNDAHLSEEENVISGVEDDENAKKKGKGPFEKLGLDVHVTKAIMRLGFKLPTPVQRKAIPAILKGCDVVAMARTGSGKTAAFALPAIQRLREHSMTVGIRCIVLEPTRELALQAAKVFRLLARFTDLRVCVLTGGSAMEAQFDRLAENPDIVVAAPGRLLHHIVETNLTLSAVDYLVMDEADQLFEMGLSDQLSQILNHLNPSRQVVLTSATLPSQLVEFSRVGLRSPEFIRLDVDDSLSENLDMWFLYTRSEEKLPSLVFLLREVLNAGATTKSTASPQPSSKGTIVFTASRHHVEFIATLLEKAHIPSSRAYGSMDQQARIESLANFKRGITKVLVVTDIAARGLDIPNVEAVINFDFPVSPKHFLHRVGRTARAGRSGTAISLITHEEFPNVVELLLFAGLKIEIPNKQQQQQQHECIFKSSPILSLSTSKNRSRPLYLGTVPDLSDDVEYVRKCLSEDYELEPLYRLMLKSYKQYNKTKREASKQSIKRSKLLLKEAGGVNTLLASVHPGLVSILKQKNQQWSLNSDRAEFLEKFRAIRPQTTATVFHGSRQSGVLPPSVVSKMQNLQYLSNLKNFTTTTTDNVKQAASDGDDEDTRRDKSEDDKSEDDKSEDDKSEDDKSEDDKSKDDAKTDVFDWKKRAMEKNKSFFLSNASNQENEFRESHLRVNCHASKTVDSITAMQGAQFDLIPDNEKDQRKLKHVRKWNAIRKKYMMTPVDAKGKVVGMKQQKKRNESGVFTRGELRKTGMYKKWSALNKKRIQNVGEIESNTTTPFYHHPKLQSDKNDRSKGPYQSDGVPSLSSLTKDKGLVEAIEKKMKLTHKQERKYKRLQQLQHGTKTIGRQQDENEIRTARQLTKTKKDSLFNKAKQNKKIREEFHKKGKEKHMRKRERQSQSKGANRRSFPIPQMKKRNKKY